MVLRGWVWVLLNDGGRALAFAYVDPTAGPSAKGARVEDPLELGAVRRAVAWPDRTFRRPADFGAVPLAVDESRRLGLPPEPPWFFVFSGKDEPPWEGEPVRRVAGRVLYQGRAVAGARVELGQGRIPANFDRLATRMTDDNGDFLFAEVATRGRLLVATYEDLGTAPIVASKEGPSLLELERLGRLEGKLWRDGRPAMGRIDLRSEDRSRRERIELSDSAGNVRIDRVVPGEYTLVARRSDQECMCDGPPIVEKITVHEGEVVQRSYTLGVGVHLAIEITCEGEEALESAMITLVSGHFVPRDNGEIRDFWRRPGMRYAMRKSRLGNLLATAFDDVLPGLYTLCVVRDLLDQWTPDSARVAWRHLTIGTESQIVKLDMPPW